jgi:hypothetical protein
MRTKPELGAVWTTDPFTNQVVRTFTLDTVKGLVADPGESRM